MGISEADVSASNSPGPSSMKCCKTWNIALPKEPRWWVDGICGPVVAQLLFGTEYHVLAECSSRGVWRRQIVFCCGNMRGSLEAQHATEFCHDLAGAHYGYPLRVADLHWPPHA